jgi:hypothetical protein
MVVELPGPGNAPSCGIGWVYVLVGLVGSSVRGFDSRLLCVGRLGPSSWVRLNSGCAWGPELLSASPSGSVGLRQSCWGELASASVWGGFTSVGSTMS